MYDVRCFLGISDLPTYPNQILYYISLCSKIRWCLTYLPKNLTSYVNAPLAHLAVHSSNPYDPLQVPAAVERKFNYIKDIRRRKFAGMLYKVFESLIEILIF